MKMKIVIKISNIQKLIPLITVVTLLTTKSYASDQKIEKIFLLSNYIMSDYENAVKDGKIVSDFEYNEMKAFCQEMLELSTEDVLGKTKELCYTIEQKGSTQKIQEILSDIIKTVGKKGGISPNKIPDFQLGEKLFLNLCSSCHGKNGDGVKADTSGSPPPSPLTTEHISPIKVYLTTKFGIEGTTMPAIVLGEKERWSVSFYASLLRYKNQEGQPTESQLTNDKIPDAFSLLFEYGPKTNQELEQIYGTSSSEIRKKVFELKNLDVFKYGILRAIDEVKKGNFDGASNILTKAYMIFEEVETELKLKNPSSVVQIELLFRDTISSMKQQKKTAEENLNKMLKNLQTLERDEKLGKTFVAFTIVLREGFEAIIIIAAILGIVSSVGIKKLPVYIGALSGIIAGIALWEATGKIISINKEIMEGVFTIFAVLLIVWVSFWVLEKTRRRNLKKFTDKVKHAATGRRYIFLFLLSFLSASREAGETVLFLRALGSGIEKGVIIGFLSLGLVAFSIYILKMKLDTRKFFILTNIILNITAVALLGKGIVELQEAGLIPISIIDIPHIDIIGIYPTIQTTVPQLILAIILFGATAVYLFREKFHLKDAEKT